MACKLAVISDIHYGTPGKLPRRKSEYGDILLSRAVQRIKESVHPDVVVVLGDCIDSATASDSMERLAQLKGILDELTCPVIVIRGNHDPEPEQFYAVFPKPPSTVDIGNVRFLTFIDPDRPGFNAERMPHDLARMRAFRGSHQGPIVSLQHVPLLPPGVTSCRYNYTNADELIEIMADQGISLALSGHEHKGTELVHRGGSAFLAVKALCEAPFTFTVITIDDTDVKVEPEYLQMPTDLGLIDCHVHTQFAYCSKGMDMAASVRLAELFGLSGIVFSEHSGQLYFNRTNYWKGTFCPEGIQSVVGRNVRMSDYWQVAEQVSSTSVWAGLEIDVDYRGNPVVQAEDMQKAGFCNGAIHHLAALHQQSPDIEAAADEFLATLQRFLGCGIQVLAHPFRVFERKKLPVPVRLYEPVIGMLKSHDVAAEINFHTNTPDPVFFRRCLEVGVKVTFGSDAHIPCMIGEFAPHLGLLKQCGYTGDLSDIMLVKTGLPPKCI
jgi:histidinol phosphatase-like PHP family hydrolase/calcineurin-like phosphoesterase family protein